MMNAPGQRASGPISKTSVGLTEKPGLLAPNLVGFLALVGFGTYLFAANTGRWGSRLAFAVAGGLVCGWASHATLRLLPPTVSHFRQQLTQRRVTWLHWALWGAAIGAALGGLVWDFSDGVLPGLQLASFLAAIGFGMGTLSVASSGQTLSQKRQSPGDISPPLLGAVFLTLVLINAPRIQVTAENDGSWSMVLNYAHSKGWQFGKQIIFTYGPLGFLTTPWFSSYSPGLRLIADAALTFSVASGVCLLAWRVPLLWRYLILAGLVLFSPNIHRDAAPHAGVDLQISQGLLCWGLLCLLESGPRLWACAAMFLGLAVFGVLSKISFLVLSCVSTIAVAACLSLRGDRKLAMGIVGAFIATCLCQWIMLGQRLSTPGDFLSSTLAVAVPYDQTMYFATPVGAQWWGVIAAASSLAMVILVSSSVFKKASGGSGRFRLLATLWLAVLAFISWKNGFARGDSYHVEAFVGFAVVLGLVMTGLGIEAGFPTTAAAPLAMITCLAGIMTLEQSFFPGYIGGCLEHSLGLLQEKVDTLFRPTRYWQLMARAGEPVRRGAQLSQLSPVIGQSSMDVFGNQQAVALFNNLNYRPRPVFASYAAYSPPLMQLNEEFYSSTNAPEFVLLKLDALVDRFPPLEDALLLRDLLVNYDPVATERGLLLLKAARKDRPRLTLLREGTTRPNEQIPLRDYGDTDLWMEIEVEPTMAGRVRGVLYNGSGVQLRVWRSVSDADSIASTAPAPMLSAGFLASPLLLNTKDVMGLYTGTRIVRPCAFAIELVPGTEPWWRMTVHFRVYKITNQLGRCGWMPVQ